MRLVHAMAVPGVHALAVRTDPVLALCPRRKLWLLPAMGRPLHSAVGGLFTYTRRSPSAKSGPPWASPSTTATPAERDREQRSAPPGDRAQIRALENLRPPQH